MSGPPAEKDVAPPTPDERAIRLDERVRIAALLTENAPTIAAFAVDTTAAIRLVAFMLDLGNPGNPATGTTVTSPAEGRLQGGDS